MEYYMTTEANKAIHSQIYPAKRSPLKRGLIQYYPGSVDVEETVCKNINRYNPLVRVLHKPDGSHWRFQPKVR